MKHIFDIFIQLVPRTWYLFTDTGAAWDVIAGEKSSDKEMIVRYAIPMIVLCVVFSAVFSFIYAEKGALPVGILKGFVTAISLMGGNYITYRGGLWYLGKYQPQFLKKQNVARLTIYSYAVVYVLILFTSLFPSLFFLKVLAVFTAYLVWEGCRAAMDMNEDERGNFVVFITLLIILVPFIIRNIFQWMLPNI